MKTKVMKRMDLLLQYIGSNVAQWRATNERMNLEMLGRFQKRITSKKLAELVRTCGWPLKIVKRYYSLCPDNTTNKIKILQKILKSGILFELIRLVLQNYLLMNFIIKYGGYLTLYTENSYLCEKLLFKSFIFFSEFNLSRGKWFDF